MRLGGARRDVELLGHALLGVAERVEREHLHLAVGQQELPPHLLGVVLHGRLAHVGQALVLVQSHDLHEDTLLPGVLLLLFLNVAACDVQELHEYDLGRYDDA